METLILSSKEVEKYVSIQRAIDCVDFVFRELGKGDIEMKPKIHVDMSRVGHEAWCNAMPAYLVNRSICGIKWIGGFGNNQSQGLPYIMGAIILSNPENGHVLSIMDGRLISDMRTGASAAIFARYLTVQDPDVLLVVGAGAQGRRAIQCLNYEYPQAEIRIFDLDKEKALILKNQLPADAQEKIVIAENLKDAAADAKVIVLLTTAQKPFLDNNMIEPGTTVLGMGTYQQVHREFALTADKIIPDSWTQAIGRGEMKPLYETGKITDDNCYAELGKIATGICSGRENDRERIFGLPVGLGAHDVCLAYTVFKKALENNDGQFFELQ